MNNTKNNINISTSINESNNTYFVHIKKNQFINLNDIENQIKIHYVNIVIMKLPQDLFINN
jgi:hypothetical protein